MLINISHNFSESKKKIDAAVGKTFKLEDRQKWGGISRQNIFITAASLDIYNLLVVNEEGNTCSIEMRPDGIIISFRSMQETYALVIPNYKLKVYKGKAEEYSFYKDQYFIKIHAGAGDAEIHEFVKKIIKNKSDNRPTRVDDL